MMDEFSFTLNSPITEEEWDFLTDVDFDQTEEITFHTKHGKEVVFEKRKTGRWIKLDMHRGMEQFKCSVCNLECYVPTCMGEPMYAFCPNCGAKMEVEHE